MYECQGNTNLVEKKEKMEKMPRCAEHMKDRCEICNTTMTLEEKIKLFEERLEAHLEQQEIREQLWQKLYKFFVDYWVFNEGHKNFPQKLVELTTLLDLKEKEN